MSLKFRPHHFLCTLGFQGKGYSPEFVANFQRIADRLRAPDGEAVSIEVVAKTDSVCDPCPNRRETACTTQEKIDLLDGAHAKKFGFTPGSRWSWGEACRRLAERMEPRDFETTCAPCSWRTLGVCETALRELKSRVGVWLLVTVLGTAMAGGSWAAPAKARKAKVATIAKKSRRAPASPQPPIAVPRELQSIRKIQDWKKVPASSLYFDHAQAMLGRQKQQDSEKALVTRKWDVAITGAESARKHWVTIQQRFSSSPWLKRYPEEMGRADLVEAQALFARKKPAASREVFERAWDRIPFSLLTWSMVDQYFQTCHKLQPVFWKDFTGNSCAAWSRRLIGAFPRNSVERSELSKRWKALVDAVDEFALPPTGGRAQQSYKLQEEDLAAWDAILPLIREGRMGKIQSPLEDFLEKFPRSSLRQKARYWLAVSQIEDGELTERSRQLLTKVLQESPLSFYGLLSAQQLGKNPDDFLSADAPEAKPRDPRLHPSELLALQKAETLLQSGNPQLLELAQMELREIRPKESHEGEFLVHLANLNSRAGSHLGAFAAVTELIQRGSRAAATQWAARIIFPVERWDLIVENAQGRRIDPLWVLSLMKQESAFDLGALSSSGAVGLMQVMPATAVETDPAILRTTMGEERHNVRIGSTYMAMMLQRFRGNIALATAAYNAGPAAVERWMRDFGLKDTEQGLSVGMVEFIESIPYRETRDYVGSIIRNYHWYSRRMPRETRPLQYFWARTSAAATATATDSSKAN